MGARRTTKTAQLSLAVDRPQTGRGGWRKGAGRPRGRTTVAHARRERFGARFVEHVTLRVRGDVPCLRRGRVLSVVKRALRAGDRADFHVVHFSLQANHLHLIVEADGAHALTRGIQGLAVRLARGINRVLGRRGKFFAERYHSRVLRTPREVRNALRYVLLNARHHAPARAKGWIDPYSSAAWFDGWSQPIVADEPWIRELLAERRATAPASRWLLTTGWRLHGLLTADEAPGEGRPVRVS